MKSDGCSYILGTSSISPTKHERFAIASNCMETVVSLMFFYPMLLYMQSRDNDVLSDNMLYYSQATEDVVKEESSSPNIGEKKNEPRFLEIKDIFQVKCFKHIYVIYNTTADILANCHCITDMRNNMTHKILRSLWRVKVYT